jgi:hypothetical protein
MDGMTSSLKTLLGVALLTVASVVAVPSSGWAECISIPTTLKQRVEGYRLVFVGDVLAVDAVIDPEPFRWRVRFRVVEAFKGTERGERVFHFATSPDDFLFRIGTRVLVYAGGPEDRVSTSCSPTRVVGTGDNDRELQELRKLSGITK